MNEQDDKRRKILEHLARDPDMIDKMNKDQRKEILEFLHAEVDRIAEEHKRGEGIMDQIEKYIADLSEEDREQFYEDLNERFVQIDKERSKGKKTKYRNQKRLIS